MSIYQHISTFAGLPVQEFTAEIGTPDEPEAVAWRISTDYDGPLLAQALCKLEGYRFEPSETDWWIHGRSSETDFLHVTTQTLSYAQLAELSELVGEARTLLVLCGAWRGDAASFPNLTVRKIPDHVLKRCDWGRDSYALPEPVEAAE